MVPLNGFEIEIPDHTDDRAFSTRERYLFSDSAAGRHAHGTNCRFIDNIIGGIPFEFFGKTATVEQFDMKDIDKGFTDIHRRKHRLKFWIFSQAIRHRCRR